MLSDKATAEESTTRLGDDGRGVKETGRRYARIGPRQVMEKKKKKIEKRKMQRKKIAKNARVHLLSRAGNFARIRISIVS